jgi:hypothetical protein
MNKERKPDVPGPAYVPVMTQTKFAELVGVDVGVVEGWVNRGHVPTAKIGKRRLVNVHQLSREVAE